MLIGPSSINYEYCINICKSSTSSLNLGVDNIHIKFLKLHMIFLPKRQNIYDRAKLFLSKAFFYEAKNSMSIS